MQFLQNMFLSSLLRCLFRIFKDRTQLCAKSVSQTVRSGSTRILGRRAKPSGTGFTAEGTEDKTWIPSPTHASNMNES